MRAALALLVTLLVAAPASAATITVDASGDADARGCTLREAITSAWKNPSPDNGCAPGEAGPDRIEIGERVVTLDKTADSGESENVSGDLDVHSAITIAGVDADSSVIDAGALGDRAFSVSILGSLTLDGVTLRGSRAPATGLGGAIAASGGGPFPELDAALVISDSVIEDNQAGGGIANSGSGTAAGGGAVYASDTTLTVRDSVFRDNRGGDAVQSGTGGAGGALLLENVVTTIERSAFVGNRAGHGGPDGGTGGWGGAIYTQGADDELTEDEREHLVTIRSTTFAENAVGSGHGASPPLGLGIVFVYENPADLEFLTFSGNTSSGNEIYGSGAATNLRGSVFDTGQSCVFVDDRGGNVREEPIDCVGEVVDDVSLRPLDDGVLIPEAGSPVIDAVDAEGCPADQRGVERPVGAACDAGAVEYRPSLATLSAPSAFGSLAVGESRGRHLTLEASGDDPLQVDGVTLSGPHAGDFSASLCPSLLVPGASCTIAAIFTPSAAGDRNATLTAVTNGGSPSVALTGTGVAADDGEPTGPTGPTGPGGGEEQITRASIAGAKLRRKGRRVRLHVRLACPAGNGCAERLVADFKHRKRRKHLERTVEMPAAKTSSRRLQLPGGYAKRLKRGARVRVKVTLRFFGYDDITKTFRLEVR